jgi:hypothetical protein
MSENETEKNNRRAAKVSPVKEPRRHRGVSVVLVVVLAAIAMAAVGTVFHLAAASSGLARSSSASAAKYNFLQHAIEEGKASLKKRMDNLNNPPRYFMNDDYYPAGLTDEGSVADGSINDSKLLLIKDGHTSRALSKSDLGQLGIAGDVGALITYTYDMQYATSKIAPGISHEELLKIPPSIIVKGADPWHKVMDILDVNHEDAESVAGVNNTGVYLIRAELIVGSETSAMESSMFQSNNM